MTAPAEMGSTNPRPCIFITSTGRTGTQLFGQIMSEMIDDSISVHEPDHLWLSRPREWLTKARQFGVYRMTLGQLDPETSLNMLSAQRVRGRISDERAESCLSNIRTGVIAASSAGAYIEANPQFIGLIDLLPRVFERARVVLVIRDPRAWIRSTVNSPLYLQYSPLDFRMWLNLRIRPGELRDDPYAEQWKRMSTFERRCWYWNVINRYALEAADRTPECLVLRFEDLFNKETASSAFTSLLEFCSDFGDVKLRYQFKSALVERKVHSTSDRGRFPPWHGWSRHRAQLLQRHCGALMECFEYGREEEWLRLIDA